MHFLEVDRIRLKFFLPIGSALTGLLLYIDLHYILLVLTINFLMMFWDKRIRFKYLPKTSAPKTISLCSDINCDYGKAAVLIMVSDKTWRESKQQLIALDNLSYGPLELLIILRHYSITETQAFKSFCNKLKRKTTVLETYNTTPVSCSFNLLSTQVGPDVKYLLYIEKGFIPLPHILSTGIRTLNDKRAAVLQMPAHHITRDKFDLDWEKYFNTDLRSATDLNAKVLNCPFILFDAYQFKQINGLSQKGVDWRIESALKFSKKNLKSIYMHTCAGSLTNYSKLKHVDLGDLSITSIKGLFPKRWIPIFIQSTAQKDYLFLPILYFAFRSLDLLGIGNFTHTGYASSAIACLTMGMSFYFNLVITDKSLGRMLGKKKVLTYTAVGLGQKYGLGKSLGDITVKLSAIIAILGAPFLLESEDFFTYSVSLAFIFLMLSTPCLLLVLKGFRKNRKKPLPSNNESVWDLKVNP